MIKSKAIILTGLAFSLFLFSQCKKDNQDEPQRPLSTKDLAVPANFDFSTTKKIAVYISIPQGIPWRTVYVMSADEKKTYLKSMPVDSISRSMISFMRVPSFLEEVLIKYGDGSLCESEIVQVSGSNLDFTFSKKSAGFKGLTDHKDTDGDQVIDYEDEYPEDPDRAYDILYPGGNTINQKGTEAFVPWSTYIFEDQWPRLDDFDYNDLVVDYYYTMVISNSLWHGQYIKEINAAFRFRASGTNYRNGFGIELIGIPAANVEDVLWRVDGGQWRNDLHNLLQEGYIDLQPNNVENNQKNAVIIISDNISEILPNPGGSTEINTLKSSSYQTPVTIEFNIKFPWAKRPYYGCSLPMWSFPWTETSLCYDKINPFLIVNGERGKEVHLANYPPTDLMNKGYFGLEDDASNISGGTFFTSETGIPWAMDINYSFEYPIENRDLIKAYPALIDWTQDAGQSRRDWYLPENCVPDHVYQVP